MANYFIRIECVHKNNISEARNLLPAHQTTTFWFGWYVTIIMVHQPDGSYI